MGATSALLVVLAATHLRVGADGFAWLIAAIGVGAVLGPFLSNWWNCMGSSLLNARDRRRSRNEGVSRVGEARLWPLSTTDLFDYQYR